MKYVEPLIMIFSFVPALFSMVRSECGPCGGYLSESGSASSAFPFLALGTAPGELVYQLSSQTPYNIPTSDALNLGLSSSFSPKVGSDATESFVSNQIQAACPGILLPPTGVKSTDYLKNGALISKYRKCVCKFCKDWEWCLKEPFVICTKRSPCKLLGEEKFVRAVIETIRIISGNTCISIPEKTYLVIRDIYIASIETGATVEQLINFTSIALHNVYLLTRFPVSSSRSIGNIPRGLLQLLSLEAYERITSISTTDYLRFPNTLDLYSRETVHDEFRTFLRFYNSKSLCGIEAFINSVQRLGSREAPLVNLRSAISVLNGTYKPSNILEERVLQRFNIYYVLTSRIFISEKRSEVIVFEN